MKNLIFLFIALFFAKSNVLAQNKVECTDTVYVSIYDYPEAFQLYEEYGVNYAMMFEDYYRFYQVSIFNQIEDKEIRKEAKFLATEKRLIGRIFQQISYRICLPTLSFKKVVELEPIVDSTYCHSFTIITLPDPADSITSVPIKNYGERIDDTNNRISFVNSCDEKFYQEGYMDLGYLFAEYEETGKLSVFNEIRYKELRRAVKECVTSNVEISSKIKNKDFAWKCWIGPVVNTMILPLPITPEMMEEWRKNNLWGPPNNPPDDNIPGSTYPEGPGDGH